MAQDGPAEFCLSHYFNNFESPQQMKIFLILFALIAGCASVGKKQAECENQYSVFSEVVLCTKQAFANDARAKNSADFKLYILKGEQLAEKVKSREITDLDAKVEWQRLYVNLKNNEESRSEAAAATYNASKPRQTVCTPVGNSVSCRTY
jgi:hypothetical protein